MLNEILIVDRFQLCSFQVITKNISLMPVFIWTRSDPQLQKVHISEIVYMICKKINISATLIIQYGSNCVLWIMEVWGFQPINITQNLPQISFLTVWQYWLGIAKPKKCLQINPKPFQQVVINFLKNYISY